MGGQSDEVFMLLADCQDFESFPRILFLSYFVLLSNVRVVGSGLLPLSSWC